MNHFVCVRLKSLPPALVRGVMIEVWTTETDEVRRAWMDDSPPTTPMEVSNQHSLITVQLSHGKKVKHVVLSFPMINLKNICLDVFFIEPSHADPRHPMHLVSCTRKRSSVTMRVGSEEGTYPLRKHYEVSMMGEVFDIDFASRETYGMVSLDSHR